MSSKFTKTKNYKADALYEELFRRHFMERFDANNDIIHDVIVHNVHTQPITHNTDVLTISVEVYLSPNEMVFSTVQAVCGRNTIIDIFIEPKLHEALHATR